MDCVNVEFGGELHLRLDDAWLQNYRSSQNAKVDCRDLDGTNKGRRMHPRGIMVGTAGNVKGVLFGENADQADIYALNANTFYPLGFKYIYADGTSARGIKVFC